MSISGEIHNPFELVKLTITELNDVDTTGTTTGDFLQFNGSQWVDFDLLAGNNTWTGLNDFDDAGKGNFHIDPSVFTYLFDDFTGNAVQTGEYAWTNHTGGVGASTTNITGEQNHPGIRRWNTGTGLSGYSGVNNRLTFLDPNGGDVMEFVVRIDATSLVLFRGGIQDSFTAVEATDGYYFEFDPLTSANWRIVTANNSTRTKTTTSTAVVANTWYRLRIEVNNANSSVEFFINGTSAGTIATNLPASGRDTGISITLENDASEAGNQLMDIDYIYYFNKNISR